MLRTTASRDTGKSSVSQGPAFCGMPFKEQQLKQLRAQCLVFLAFRYMTLPVASAFSFTIMGIMQYKPLFAQVGSLFFSFLKFIYAEMVWFQRNCILKLHWETYFQGKVNNV